MTRPNVQELEVVQEEQEEDVDVEEEPDGDDGKYGRTVDKEHWIMDKHNKERSSTCIASIHGKSCKFAPWKHRKDLKLPPEENVMVVVCPTSKLAHHDAQGGVRKKRLVHSKKKNEFCCDVKSF